jgi:chromosome segregation ATPase
MPRSWPERLAKRIGRLSQNLDQIEAKGRTADKSYSRMLEELGDLCCQILDARDKAKAELSQATTDALFLRRKLAEERSAFNAERAAFHEERDRIRAARKMELAELAQAQSEISRERADMAFASARANEVERKFKNFMGQMKKAAGKL